MWMVSNRSKPRLLTPHVTPTCTPCPIVLGRRRKGTLHERYLSGICRGTSPSPPRGGEKGLSLASPAGTCSCRWAVSASAKRRSCEPSAGFEHPVASGRRHRPAKQRHGVSQHLGGNLQRSPSRLLLGLKPCADVHLGILQRVCSPGGTPKLCRAG